jgi:hypothetical protein
MKKLQRLQIELSFIAPFPRSVVISGSRGLPHADFKRWVDVYLSRIGDLAKRSRLRAF